MPRLLSVNVGLPRDVTWNGKTVRTAVWKSPVAGRRMVRKLDIDGDAQAFAARYKLDNLTILADVNALGQSEPTMYRHVWRFTSRNSTWKTG